MYICIFIYVGKSLSQATPDRQEGENLMKVLAKEIVEKVRIYTYTHIFEYTCVCIHSRF
jgi:hypothetical protein